ncbi:Cytochrome p450 [Mycena chlorophos]|uniref:Cytochrome p450 n=1 Tax=Mycena chlorophos TaxID=658473 RepID=A0A8H6TSQ5_MYCCL|nr:Cytochrome p450 [Mycena chlorophos]
MLSPPFQAPHVVVLAVAVSVSAYALLRRRYRARLPPGPTPLLGAQALPTRSQKEWEVYGEWAEKWGELTSVVVFGQPIVVVSSRKMATQMLEKKSLVYSDRPVFQMCGELVGWSKGLAFLSYGPRLKQTRKYAHSLLGTATNVKRFESVLSDQYHKFLRRLLESPDDFLSHIHFTSSNVILQITYGYQPTGPDDPLLGFVRKVMDEFSEAAAPGEYLVEVLPILKYVPSWMPGAAFKRKAKIWRHNLTEMMNRPFKIVEDQLANGTARDSFVSLLLQEDLSEADKEYMKWAAGTLYGAATDTTSTVISQFFLQMALNPEIQARAQKEIDGVTGGHRLPTYGDREDLPYLNALCKELFRFHPVGPMGLPHRAMEDDVQNGYLIPKGSIVFANIWKMAHDPTAYSNPMTFDPARFLGDEPEADPRDFVFGFGRRVCSGKYLADTSVFIACAYTLATFNISKTVEDGKIIEPRVDYLSGTISQLAPFSCSIKPRSLATAALIP